MSKLSDEEIEELLEQLDDEFEELSEQSEFNDIYKEVDQIGHLITQLSLMIPAVRQRGYVHSGQMEDKLAAYASRWPQIEPEVNENIESSIDYLDDYKQDAENDLDKADDTWKNKHIDAAQHSISLFAKEVDKARKDVQSMYTPIHIGLQEVEAELEQIVWMLDQIEESQEIRLQPAEGPYAAVEAEWELDGKEGPDGILFLTDQRLLFEQKEKIAKKKFLNLITTESELVQKLLLNVSIPEIESVEHSEEGGFLGMGKADVLKLVFASSAPVSRARFHLKGQDSSDWAAWIKKMQTGNVDRDRVQSARAEREKVKAITFPEQCPGCFAALPSPPHGVTTVTCEFCGRTIQPLTK